MFVWASTTCTIHAHTCLYTYGLRYKRKEMQDSTIPASGGNPLPFHTGELYVRNSKCRIPLVTLRLDEWNSMIPWMDPWNRAIQRTHGTVEWNSTIPRETMEWNSTIPQKTTLWNSTIPSYFYGSMELWWDCSL